MRSERRTFKRELGTRRYRKLFVIAVEGRKSEGQYFSIFNNQYSNLKITCLKGKDRSSPPDVLGRMNRHLGKESLKDSDEAWLVVDKDQWTDEQLNALHAWSLRKHNYGFALSNPKFELWLLFHFEDPATICSSRDCSDRLRRYLPHYDKEINVRKFTKEMVQKAIQRAEEKDKPPCEDWPRYLGKTTVYRLVRNILRSGEPQNG